MRTWLRMKWTAAVTIMGLSVGLPMLPSQFAHAADPLMKEVLVLAQVGEGHVPASGAAEDTLKACLARIPKVASVGQRMLAEQTCAGEEETRKAIRVAPKF
jgi:hypothetical protein